MMASLRLALGSWCWVILAARDSLELHERSIDRNCGPVI
jgi:hypothetical protein